MAKKQKVLRCLCVRPPAAGEIVDGEKKEEYRSRPTNIRERIGIIESGSGTIIGEVDLVGCIEDDFDFFIWKLKHPVRYKKPRPYKHPNGAVVWVRVPV